LSHAVIIKVNGQAVGAINEWNPRMNRTVTEMFEFGAVTQGGAPNNGTDMYATESGLPFEKAPGNVSGMQVDVRRYDVYTIQMEQAMGTGELHTLANQLNPFEVQERWAFPATATAAGGQPYYNWYRGCWFSDLGRTISATGDRIINVNATIQYTRRTRVV
jgi:hypothetical protein